MKTLFAVILLAVATFGASAAFAKKKPRIIYDHTATMTYHGPNVKNLLDGRTDLYYAGDYTCRPGSEHYAPDCRLSTDWYITVAVSYIEIRLEDNTEIAVTTWPCDPEIMSAKYCREHEPWDHEKAQTITLLDRGNPYLDIATDWQAGKAFGRYNEKLESLKDGAKKTFHYSIQNGEIEIDPLDLLQAGVR